MYWDGDEGDFYNTIESNTKHKLDGFEKKESGAGNQKWMGGLEGDEGGNGRLAGRLGGWGWLTGLGAGIMDMLMDTDTDM